MSVEHDAGSMWSPIAALHLFSSLLGEVETATPGSSFYDQLAEAVCRLGSMRRATVFLYDELHRRVRAVGGHRIDVDVFADVHEHINPIPLAARALERDEVLEVTGDLAREVPPEYVDRLGLRKITCIPMSAGGRHYGVVVAEPADGAALTEHERETLWTLGKVCALASAARHATRQQERARQLTDRLDLARDVHERIVQRLFGVSLALGSPGDLTPEQRSRCADELQAATEELRDAMQRPLAPMPREVVSTLREELDRLERDHPDLPLQVTWDDGAEIPEPLEPLAQTVLSEALRNARKHAEASRIDVRVGRSDDTVALEVVNDGVRADTPHRGGGMGLRLAAFEALHHGAAVDFGRTPPDRWHVRLVLPTVP